MTIRVYLMCATLLCPGVAVAQMTGGGPAAGGDAGPAPVADQMAAAVLAAPETMRADATIVGWDAAGKTVILRQGTGELVCLSDRPGDTAFSVACYHRDLEPYMARGRQLTAEGVTGGNRNAEHRWKEVQEGTLAMPDGPRMLYVVSGTSFDAIAGTVTEPYERWVLYWPNATAETVGLSATPAGPGVPWLMDAGTPGAHVMISPPRARD